MYTVQSLVLIVHCKLKCTMYIVKLHCTGQSRPVARGGGTLSETKRRKWKNGKEGNEKWMKKKGGENCHKINFF